MKIFRLFYLSIQVILVSKYCPSGHMFPSDDTSIKNVLLLSTSIGHTEHTLFLSIEGLNNYFQNGFKYFMGGISYASG